jgi:hypothetical protein
MRTAGACGHAQLLSPAGPEVSIKMAKLRPPTWSQRSVSPTKLGHAHMHDDVIREHCYMSQ